MIDWTVYKKPRSVRDVTAIGCCAPDGVQTRWRCCLRVFVAKVRLKNEMFQRNPTRQINNTPRTLMHENSKNEYWKFGTSQIGLWTELRYPVSAGERRGSATKYLNSLANEVTAELTAE